MNPEHTFLFADLSGYTALTEVHGDDDAAGAAERLCALVSDALTGSTRLVKTLGDGVMLVADRAPDAVATALRLLELAAREPLFPALRAGIHCGSAAERGGDYYGAAVNTAARLVGLARAGEVLCTREVASRLDPAAAICVTPLGPADLKNVSAPVELFRLASNRSAPEPAIDPVCRMQVDPAGAAVTLTVASCTYYFCSRHCADVFVAREGGR